MATGGVRCWGSNSSGQLGDGTTTTGLIPPANDLTTDVQAVAVAIGEYHTCMLTTAGGVRCWGSNYLGQLGDGTPQIRSIIPDSDVIAGVKAIAAGEQFTCALMTTGGVRCWGDGAEGQLGYGSVGYSKVPVPVPVTCQ